jgi:hypothetical protein
VPGAEEDEVGELVAVDLLVFVVVVAVLVVLELSDIRFLIPEMTERPVPIAERIGSMVGPYSASSVLADRRSVIGQSAAF